MRKILFVTAAAMLVASPALAKGMKWMDASGAGLPAGAKMAVVSGDPSKAGDFVIRAGFVAATRNGRDFHENTGAKRAV